jgi:hypothetical protein
MEGGENVRYLSWVAVPIMLLGAAMLLADIGASGVWIAIIAVGIALVALDLYERKHPHLTS